MVLDTGADQVILKSTEKFIDLSPIPPISIKTADGRCHLQATHRGKAVIELFDDQGGPQSMTLDGALYCKEISVNLISAIRLVDTGCKFKGDSTSIVFTNPNGEQLHARRKSNTNKLWTVRPNHLQSCLLVSTDIMHQRLGHLHSAALKRFCTDGGKSNNTCTSCIVAKSHRHPF